MSARRGFHRIGVVFAVPFLLGAMVLLGVAGYTYATPPENRPWYRHQAQQDLDRVKANIPKVRLDPARDFDLYMLSEGFPVSEFLSKTDAELVELRAAALFVADKRRKVLDARGYLVGAGLCVLAALLLYAINWSVGWVVRGFRG